MDGCYRLVKPVDIGPLLPLVEGLQFVHVNQGGTTAAHYGCDVVLYDKFPPELKQFVTDLNLGGELARAILRRLPPRQSIPPHIDAWMPAEADWHRFQVPFVTHPDIIMRWPDDDVAVHLAPGFLYEVRFDRTHQVDHNADCYRIHMQIDQVNATI